MRHLGLFEGIGGFSLAARWMGWETIAWVEIDKFCQQVLKKNFPNAKGYGDIKEFDGSAYRGTVDIITGGFPCQPFSSAGERRGTEDDRHLWPEMFRVIGEIQPPYIVGENVSGFVDWSGGMVFDQVQTSLEDKGYEVQSFILPACGVKAAHRRDRVWIIAYNSSFAFQKSEMDKKTWPTQKPRVTTRGLPCGIWTPDKETNFIELAGELHGLPLEVDRIKSLGNAIVPQVAYEIFQAIEKVKTNYETPL